MNVAINWKIPNISSYPLWQLTCLTNQIAIKKSNKLINPLSRDSYDPFSELLNHNFPLINSLFLTCKLKNNAFPLWKLDFDLYVCSFLGLAPTQQVKQACGRYRSTFPNGYGFGFDFDLESKSETTNHSTRLGH